MKGYLVERVLDIAIGFDVSHSVPDDSQSHDLVVDIGP
jgi:hypothetical protein